MVFEENEGYLFSDAWPFLIIHFGEKIDVPSPKEILRTSLATLVDSFWAEQCRGYDQGKEAYAAWIKGLSQEDDFRLEHDRENVMRRLNVNDSMLCNLEDARRAAASYLRGNRALLTEQGQEYLTKIAKNEQTIADMVFAFRNKINRSSSDNMVKIFGASTPQLRREQISLLEKVLVLEEENCRLAGLILESTDESDHVVQLAESSGRH